MRVVDWFLSWFGGVRVPKVLTDLVSQAVPVVLDIEKKLKKDVLEGGAVLMDYTQRHVKAFLKEYDSDDTKVVEFVKSLQGKSRSEILSGVAFYIVRKYAPDVASSLIRLAVELAYFGAVKSRSANETKA